jgi:cytochrome c oxidase assembly factor CtaG
MRVIELTVRAAYKFAPAWVFGLTLWADSARAHGATVPGRISFAAWEWPPFIIIPLLLSAAVYSAGAVRMWRRNSHAGLSWESIICFASGWLSLLAALDSPIHELGEQLFSAHMVQHEILMLVSAPLLLLGRPSLVFVWALPQRWRKIVPLTNSRFIRGPWSLISTPVAAWSLHAVALWLWHAPVLFDATLRSDAVHATQHISFFATALLFWWTLFGEHRSRLGDGAAMVYVFTTAVHMSILGALLTFAPRPWYPGYTSTAPVWRLSALEDQQLGGLIMWIPAGTILFITTLFLLLRWMKHSDERWQLGTTASLMRQTASSRHEH